MPAEAPLPLAPPFNQTSAVVKLAELRAERRWDWPTVQRRCEAAARKLTEAKNRGTEVRNPVGFGLRLVATMPEAEVEEALQGEAPRARLSEEERALRRHRAAMERQLHEREARERAKREAAQQRGARPLDTDPRRKVVGTALLYDGHSVREARRRLLGDAHAEPPEGAYRKRLRFNDRQED